MSNDIDIGAISEALNYKVDLDQKNTNAQGLSYVSGCGMPSDRYVDLGHVLDTYQGLGKEYVAPANGYIYINVLVYSSNSNVDKFTFAIQNLTRGISLHRTTYLGDDPSGLVTELMPVLKGDVYSFFYDFGTGSYSVSGNCRFIYAEGAI